MARFGAFELDVPARELRREGALVHLEPQAFDLLAFLVDQRDRVVPKPELLDAVWGHRFVSESALTTRVKEVRRALGDDGQRQAFVKNVPGRGYRFVASLDPETETGRMAAPSAPLDTRSGLVGRDVLSSSTLQTLVDGSPLVTLVGPGGVGKSTLAREVAGRWSRRTGHPAVTVELSTVGLASEVLPAVARALDTVLDTGRPDRAVAAVAAWPGLVVLDNCEHVVDEVATLLDAVTGSFQVAVRVLATSQVRIGLGMETVVGVEALDLAAAAELFARRALAVRPSLPVDELHPRILSLVEQLDRLPLTVEMAAARLVAMTFDELEAVVGTRDRLLQVTHRTPTARHRTLTSMVEWSTTLLAPLERDALTQCAVFAGPFTVAAARRVLPDAAGEVPALAERSLLATDLGGPVARHRMLETVRAVATGWLDGRVDAEAVRGRHLDWVLAEATTADRELRGTDEPLGRRHFDDLVAEARQAHRWSSVVDPVGAARLSARLHLIGYSTFWQEPAEWSRRVLHLHPDLPHQALAGAHVVVAAADANSGDLASARDHLQSLRDNADAHLAGTALEILSDVAIYAGEFDDACRQAAQLCAIGEEVGDHHFTAMGTTNFALACTFARRPDEGLARLDEFRDQLVSASARSWLTYARGEALSASHRPALPTIFEALQLARAAGNPFVVSVSQQSAASEMARSGDLAGALSMYGECLRDSVRHGNFVHAVTTVRNLIECLVAVGADEGAAELAGATSRPELRASHGVEAERLHEVVDGLRGRLGTARFDEIHAAGQELVVDDAVRRAIAIIASL